jgi:hypothetical protein
MFTLSVRVKFFLLLVLALSTLSLNKARACDIQHCAELYNRDGELKGHGCAAGGGFIECFAKVDGCTILYCAE